MAFIPCLNTVEVSFIFEVGGREVRCVMGVQKSTGWSLPTMQALGTAVVDVIKTNHLGWISPDYTLTKIHLTDLTTDSSPSFDWITGTSSNLPQPGTSIITGNAGGQMALVTTLRTDLRGRSFRGRNYWPGLNGNMLGSDHRTVVGTRALDQDTFVDDLITAINAVTGCSVVVISRHSGGVAREAGVMTLVTSHDTNDIIDTQRRRVEP